MVRAFTHCVTHKLYVLIFAEISSLAIDGAFVFGRGTLCKAHISLLASNLQAKLLK